MALSFTRLDGRLLLVHLLAVPCFVLGMQQLQLLRWVPLLELYQAGGIAAVHHRSPADFSTTIAAMSTGPLYAWAAAVVGACLLSAAVTWRRRASGLIPVLLLGLAIVTSWTRYYQSTPVYQTLAYLRGLLAPFCSWKAQLGMVGGLLILLGLMPFLRTWSGPPIARNSAANPSFGVPERV